MAGVSVRLTVRERSGAVGAGRGGRPWADSGGLVPDAHERSSRCLQIGMYCPVSRRFLVFGDALNRWSRSLLESASAPPSSPLLESGR